MISKKGMDTLQVNAYYNDFYLLEIKKITKNNIVGVCLCKKCHRYNFFSLGDLAAAALKNKIKCQYCSSQSNSKENYEIERWKKEAAEEKKQKEDLLKQEYKNNKALNKKSVEEIRKENTEKLQVRILSEQKRKDLTEDQKQYLNNFDKKTKGSQGEKEVSLILSK